MTLPASGPISFNAINVELAVSGTTQASLGQASYRTLAGVPSGAISMSNFYGKSNRGAASTTLGGGGAISLNITTLPGYVAGNTTVTITVSGICWGSGGTPGLTLTGGSGTDTISLINNSYITGSGGAGGVGAAIGGNGGPALSLGWPVTITNNGYIGGGGGGGYGTSGAVNVNGGAGAGGNSSSGTGGTGTAYNGNPYARGLAGGGGGGWAGTGGRAAGAHNNGSCTSTGGAGGGAGSTGGDGYINVPYGLTAYGGSGGKAINLNGRSVSWGGPGQVRVYGGIS